MSMLDQFQSFMHDFIDKIVDVKADGNYGYQSVSVLLGMGEDFGRWSATICLKNLANSHKTISSSLVARRDLRN